MEMTAKVVRIEYDPNRSAYIALCEYEDGELRYILAPVGLNAGDTSSPPPPRISSRATACRLPTSPSAPSSTTSSSTPARAPSSSVPPAAPRS
jgi:hypothetical protein